MSFIWAGGVTQVVACLLSKHEVLSSNPIEQTKSHLYGSMWEWGLNSGLHAYKAGALLLESYL
jgi:hypothetical protein